MKATTCLETGITFLILAFAAVMGFSRGGIHTAIWLLFLTATIRYFRQPFPIVVEKDIRRAMLIFFGALGLSTLFSSDIVASLKFLGISFIRILPFFVVLAYVKEQKKSERAIPLMAGSMLIGASIAIWQGLNGMWRAKSTLGVMDFAGIIGLIVPVLLVKGLAHNTGKLSRILYISAALAALVALLFNNTRAVWVSLAITCTIFILINIIMYGRRNLRVTLFLIAVLAAVSLLVLSFQYFEMRFLTLFAETKSNRERIQMWTYGWEIFKSHPLLGVGLATLPTLPLTPEQALELKANPAYGHVHNNFLQIMAENGIIGLAAWCILFFSILKTAVGKLKSPVVGEWATIALLCTIEFLLHGLFDYTFTISTIMYAYWFILGLAYANYATDKQ